MSVSESRSPIFEPYLLVIDIPFFIDQNHDRWAEPLWQKDLVEHLTYLKNLSIAAPARKSRPPHGACCISSDERFSNVTYIDLPASISFSAALFNLPKTFARLWTAAGRTRIIHAGVAGWPIPAGWTATLIARLRRRILIINVESAFWRVAATEPLHRRIRANVWETINRWCVRRATLPLFTHKEYARQFLPKNERAHIFQASWIDATNVLDRQTAELSWNLKEERPLKVLFAGRLTPEKGLQDLLETFTDREIPIQLDVVGSGPMEKAVRDVSARDSRVKLLSPVPYGASFFELLRNYHALIVPTRTDEQPRVVYDAYSQAVPVIATGTPGNLACVVDGQTGFIQPPNAAGAIASLLYRAHLGRRALRQMGMQALELAAGYTHQEMHRQRWEMLDRYLKELTR